MTLDILQDNGTPQEEPILLNLKIQKDKDQVTITIPAFSFVINLPFPDVSYYATGGVLATIDGFLPKDLWPNNIVYQSFPLQSNLNPEVSLFLLVSNSGSFYVESKQNPANFIPDGTYSVQSTTITYLVDKKCCCNALVKTPTNVRITEKTSSARVPLFFGGQFLEFYNNDFVNGKFAICWADNSDDLPQPTNKRRYANQKVLTGHINKNGNSLTIVKENERTVVSVPEREFCVEQSVSLHPTDPNFVYAVTTHIRPRDLFPLNNFAGNRSISTDFGANWTTVLTDKQPFNDALKVRGDHQGYIDKYGNLYYLAVYVYPPQPTPFDINNAFIGISVSSDNGANFTELARMEPTLDADFADYPRISGGGDGNGGYGVWISQTNTQFQAGPPGRTRVLFIPVTGLGAFGTKLETTIYTGTTNTTRIFGEPEILATPSGKVYVMCTANSGTPLGTYLFVNKNGAYDADNNPILDESSFGEPKLIANTFGWTKSIAPTYQNFRRIYTRSFNFAHDPEKDRLFVGFVDMKPGYSEDMTLFLVYSDDDGNTWKGPVQISDTTVGNRGTLNMSRDNVSDSDTYGCLLFSWFDARRDPDNKEVDVFMAVFDPISLP